jgi:hypothetical protein
MQPCQNISHIQVLVIYFCSTRPINQQLGQQIGGSLLVGPTKTNQKQAVNKFNLIIFIKLFQSSSKALEDVQYSGVTTNF